jgi:acetyltransferase-like isoleucine patch superfamily enzyme
MSKLKIIILLLCTVLPSSLRISVLRLMKFKIGRGCRISPGSIVVAESIEMHSGAVIEPLVFIYCPKSFVMGERSRIAGFVRIIGYGEVELKPQSFIALACLIDCTTRFELGDRSQIGPRGLYYSHGGTGLIFNKRYPHRIGPIRIGKDCWLGMGCIVYPNVIIGDEVVVLPGMVISSNLDSKQALFPPQKSYHIVPVDFVRMNVTEEMIRAEMEKALEEYAATEKSSYLHKVNEDYWVLTLRDNYRIIFLRGQEIPKEVVAEQPSNKTIIWCLHSFENDLQVPTFVFGDLTVKGGWTPFAERIAKFLCEQGGAHFIFLPREDKNWSL